MTKENYFHCPSCNSVEKHIEVPASEYTQASDSQDLHVLGLNLKDTFRIARIISFKISDALGISSLVGDLTGTRVWKCTKCAIVLKRVQNKVNPPD